MQKGQVSRKSGGTSIHRREHQHKQNVRNQTAERHIEKPDRVQARWKKGHNHTRRAKKQCERANRKERLARIISNKNFFPPQILF